MGGDEGPESSGAPVSGGFWAWAGRAVSIAGAARRTMSQDRRGGWGASPHREHVERRIAPIVPDASQPCPREAALPPGMNVR